MNTEQLWRVFKSSGGSFHSLKGRVSMSRVIRSGIMVLVLLVFTLPASAAPSTQATGCSWYFADTLAMTPEYNPYADIPMTWSVRYVPPHNYGDRDFSGNGPRVQVDVSTFVSSEGIGAKVTMEAAETQKDWTTASGTSGDLWFLRLRKGWSLKAIGIVDYAMAAPTSLLGQRSPARKDGFGILR